jgi:4-hydroxybenzoate polyprenyltransferase
MALVGMMLQLNGAFYWSLLLAAGLFVHQQKLIAQRERDPCFQAFLNNNYVGMVLFLGILLSTVPFADLL